MFYMYEGQVIWNSLVTLNLIWSDVSSSPLDGILCPSAH